MDKSFFKNSHPEQSEDSESELVEKSKSDPQAFGELYEIYYSKILNYIYRHVLNAETAETLTSNTFFNVLKMLPKYKCKTTFRAWIYHIASNEIKMFWRSEKNRRNREENFYVKWDIEDVYFTNDELEIKEDLENNKRLFEILHKCLSELPGKYRTTLILRYFEHLSYSEIGQVINKKDGTVKSLLHRGLEKLRKIMEKNNATFLPPLH